MALFQDDDTRDSTFPFTRHEVNGSFATASNVDLNPYFTVGNTPNINDPAAPTASIVGSIDVANDVDVYKFVVLPDDAGNVTLTFDIDYANASGLDSQIQLFDANGTFLKDNDDASVLDPGSTNTHDSLMTYTPTVAGTYYISVTSFNNDWRGTGDGSGGNSTGDYTLHISQSGSPGIQSYGDGTLGGDDLFGDVHGDVVDDTIYGYAGNDTIQGYDGNDTLYGNDGADALFGNDGNDFLFGEAYFGLPFDGPGDEDTIYGGAGDDTIYGGNGNDIIYGGDGNDIISGGNLDEGFLGPGNDDQGNDTMTGGAGADTYAPESTSNPGDDTFVIGKTDSTPDAHDVFKYDGTDESFNGAGAAGGDKISFSGLSSPVFWHGQTSFATAIGSALAGGGNGVIEGFFNHASATESWLVVDVDDDGVVSARDIVLEFQTASGTQVPSLILDDFTAGQVVAPVIGTAANESFTGTGASDYVLAGAGNDIINSLNGVDVISGEAGKDRINGGEGNDFLAGGTENDTIQGGNGVDTINGGLGVDNLSGGAGHDRFVYNAVAESTGATFDTITDFNALQDALVLPFAVTHVDPAVVGGTLTHAHFGADLHTDIGTKLHAGRALVFEPDHGDYVGRAFLIVDANGIAGYQSSADFVIDVTGISGTLRPGDFVLST